MLNSQETFQSCTSNQQTRKPDSQAFTLLLTPAYFLNAYAHQGGDYEQ